MCVRLAKTIDDDADDGGDVESGEMFDCIFDCDDER